MRIVLTTYIRRAPSRPKSFETKVSILEFHKGLCSTLTWNFLLSEHFSML